MALLVVANLFKCTPTMKVQAPGIPYPVTVRIKTMDVSVFRQVLVEGEYAFLLPKQPKVIVDAGANIGMTSVFYATRYPTARIFAIEPESSNHKVLEKNVRPYPNVTPIRAALWFENGPVGLRDPGVGSFAFQTWKSGGTVPREQVPGMTIDRLMADHGIERIDLLKVDIEGAEKEVFEHPDAWIGKVGMIAIECHDNVRPGCSAAVDAATSDFPTRCANRETAFMARAGHS